MPQSPDEAALTSTVSWCTNQLTAAEDDSYVVLSLDQGKYFGFDAIGNYIWRALESPCRLGDLVDALCIRYDADRNAIAEDLLAFVAKLRERGLVVVT